MSSVRVAVLALLSLVLFPTFAPAQVKVVKAPAVVERKTYDPKDRPADAPPVRGNEEGVVSAKFIVTTIPGFTPGTNKQDEKTGQWTANVRTQQMELQLQLKVQIWTPEGISDKAKAHLEGHRQIVEDIYKAIDKPAFKMGQMYIGRGSKGAGESLQAAQKEALQALMKPLGEEYLAATEKRADRIHDIYDELTGQGTKDEAKETDAVKQAFAQQVKEEAESKKATKKLPK